MGLTDDHYARRQIQRFLLGVASLIALLLLILGLTPVGTWLTRDVHSLTIQLATEVQFALLCMVPLVFVDAFARYYAGLLLRYRQSVWTSAATSAKICASIIAVFAFLPLDLVHARPIWLPILVIYAGGVAEMAVVLWGHLNVVRDRLPAQSGRGTAWCCLLGITCMGIVCWTPLLEFGLVNLVGLEKAVAVASRTPLLIYSFTPLFTAPRGYLHGLAVVQHRTRALVPSTPARLVMIVLACLSLPLWGVVGATLAAAAVLSGVAIETLVVWWCLRRSQGATGPAS